MRLSNVQIEVEEELKKCQLSKRESTRAQVNTIVVSTKKDSTCTNLPSDERLEGLRSEFSALLNELYRRGGSLTKNKIDEVKKLVYILRYFDIYFTIKNFNLYLVYSSYLVKYI